MKMANKVDFRKFLDPIQGLVLKGFKIRDPQISWYPFGTKNHEIRRPPVHTSDTVNQYRISVSHYDFVIRTFY